MSYLLCLHSAMYRMQQLARGVMWRRRALARVRGARRGGPGGGGAARTCCGRETRRRPLTLRARTKARQEED